LIREFTIKKPVVGKILIRDSLPSSENPFKDTPIDISNDVIYGKLEEKLNLKATSFLDSGFIEIACENTDEEIKQCLIDLNLEYSEPVRTEPVCESEEYGKKTVPDDFVLSINERETIRKTIEDKLKEV
jgi:hypothetical protein